MLDCRQDTLVLYSYLVAATHTWHHLNQISLLGLIRPQDIVLVIHVFSNCLLAFLCIIFRRGFILGQQPCRPIWWSVRRMIWTLTGWPPTPSTSAAMLAALIVYFPKHNLWIWHWACALNFFGWPWRGLFWVEPVLLKNRCMVLATGLQLSFRVLAIFL